MTEQPNQPTIEPQKVRRYGWKPSKPDYRDEKYMYRPTATVTLPIQAKLDPAFLPPIGDQGDQGSCTGWSTARACDFLRAKSGQDRRVVLSPRFAYWVARQIEGTTREDAGAEIRNVVKGIQKYGVASLRTAPYSARNYRTPPNPAAWLEARFDVLKEYNRIGDTGDRRVRLIKHALVNQHPVVFGFAVHENFDKGDVDRTGMVPMPDGDLLSGHAVWIDQYDDTKQVLDQTGAFRIVNSWGTGWGLKGYCWMPYAFVGNGNICDDFWVLRGIT